MKRIGALIFAGLVALALAAFSAGQSQAAGGTAKAEKDIVVILHGLGRTASATWLLANRLSDAGYRVEQIGYRSLRDTPQKILRDIDRKIENCCIGKSPRLHFVGHSLGGLIVRAYLSKKKIANLGRVVLLGSPNGGTSFVDKHRDKWWFAALGPTAPLLGTGNNSFGKSLPRPHYPLGVVAGDSGNRAGLKLSKEQGDGLVSLQSAKVEGMKDFIVIKTSHSMLLYDGRAAERTKRFLKTGRFRTH